MTLLAAAADTGVQLGTGEAVTFWVLAPVALAGALGMVLSRNAVHSALYLVTAMLALGAHIHHGFWSACQTLGLTNTARSRGRAKRVSLTLAVVVAVGFSLVPLAVVAGVIEK